MLGIVLVHAALCVIGGCTYDRYPNYKASPEEVASFRQGASRYLKEKYAERMVLVGNAEYEGKPIYSFSVKARPSSDPRIVFEVTRNNEAEIDSPGWTYPGYLDDYPDVLWAVQAKQELEPVIKQLLSKQAYFEQIYVQDTDSIKQQKNLMVPSYKEIRNPRILKKYSDGEILTGLHIKVPKVVGKADIDTESKRIFLLISYLNRQKIEVHSFQVSYIAGLVVQISSGRRLSYIINLERLREFTVSK